MDSSFDMDALPPEVRDELTRLDTVSRSTEAYARLLEGALLAAWSAGENERKRLLARPEAELDLADRSRRQAWEVAGEVVVRLPPRDR